VHSAFIGHRLQAAGARTIAERHMLRGRSREIQVVHRPNHATGRVEHNVQVDRCQRHSLGYDAEQHEDVRDHDACKQLEEVLDPQVDHPETPDVSRREVVPGLGEQPDRVEGG